MINLFRYDIGKSIKIVQGDILKLCLPERNYSFIYMVLTDKPKSDRRILVYDFNQQKIRYFTWDHDSHYFVPYRNEIIYAKNYKNT